MLLNFKPSDRVPELIRWDFQAQPSPKFTEKIEEKKKIREAGVLWAHVPLGEGPDWLQKDKRELKEPTVPADGLKAAEECAGCRCCQLRTANSGYTQTRQHLATDE